jgi:hypothetical protein
VIEKYTSPRKLLLLCFVALLLLFCGCKKSTQSSSNNETTASPAAAKQDVCAFITRDEIAAIQGSPIKETKSSTSSNNGFRIGQCFYTAEEFSKSVVLTVTRRKIASSAKQTPKDYWKSVFGGEPPKEKENEREGEEEKRSAPRRIEGIGDEAFWTGVRFGGALYVLKDDTFIRVSIGGGDTEEDKINKSKKLARKALERL